MLGFPQNSLFISKIYHLTMLLITQLQWLFVTVNTLNKSKLKN